MLKIVKNCYDHQEILDFLVLCIINRHHRQKCSFSVVLKMMRNVYRNVGDEITITVKLLLLIYWGNMSSISM